MTKNIYRYMSVLAFIVMLLFGIYHIKRVIQSGNEEYGEITRIAQTAATMMHWDDLYALDAVPEDSSKQEYVKLKKMLQQIKRINQSARFSYIYTMREGNVVFMVDSEPQNDPESSPPGQIYVGATELDKKLMDNGSTQTIEFSEDRWGKWVSILVPLIDPETNKTLAVFGMDFDVKIWRAIRWNDLLMASLIVLLSLIAIIFIFIIISNNQKLKKDYLLLKRTELDLLAAKEKAEESNRLKTSFLKNISHEIRTPMNSILGFADLLKEPDLSNESKELYLTNMMYSGQRMLNTISDIIEMSRIQSGQVIPLYVRTNMGELLYLLLEAFSETAKEKGLDYRGNISQTDKELFFYTDNHLLNSILKKLLWNALKFTSKGFIEFGYKVKNDTLEFFVKDSGVGIEKDHESFIFDYFRQGNDLMNRNHEGNGIGLAIAKANVELLGGSIWVESELGVGSTFTFTIPYHKHEPLIT